VNPISQEGSVVKVLLKWFVRPRLRVFFSTVITSTGGATENARHENTGRSKMQDLKMRDMKMRDQVAGVEMREKLVWKAKV